VIVETKKENTKRNIITENLNQEAELPIENIKKLATSNKASTVERGMVQDRGLVLTPKIESLNE